jgi:hypothetical protein
MGDVPYDDDLPDELYTPNGEGEGDAPRDGETSEPARSA